MNVESTKPIVDCTLLELRDRIGQALHDVLVDQMDGAKDADWFDSRNVDCLADAAISTISPILVQLGQLQAKTAPGVPEGWLILEQDGGFIHIESPQALAVNVGYLPEGSRSASQLLRLLAIALLNASPDDGEDE